MAKNAKRVAVTDVEREGIIFDRTKVGMSWQELMTKYERSNSVIARVLRESGSFVRSNAKPDPVKLANKALAHVNGAVTVSQKKDQFKVMVSTFVQRLREIGVTNFSVNLETNECSVDYKKSETFTAS